MAQGYRRFRARGMPFATAPRERPHGTWPACRVVVAARRLHPGRELAVFRALQFMQFTTTGSFERPGDLERAIAPVPGIDAAAVVAAATDPDTEALFAADRAEARSAAGSPTELMDRSATTPEGEVRYTAPSLLFERDGRRLEAGGFQPLEAYDVVVANLGPDLTRRPPAGADELPELLDTFPDGLTTGEIAAVMAPNNAAPDRDAAEEALIALTAAGGADRTAVGNDAVWTRPGTPVPVAAPALAGVA